MGAGRVSPRGAPLDASPSAGGSSRDDAEPAGYLGLAHTPRSATVQLPRISQLGNFTARLCAASPRATSVLPLNRQGSTSRAGAPGTSPRFVAPSMRRAGASIGAGAGGRSLDKQ